VLLAGEIGKPHGLDGEVYVLRLSDDPHRFDPGESLTHEDGRTLVIESSRPHNKDRFLVKFEGIDVREAAVRLRGALYVSEDARRELDDGEYWIDDLKGAAVHLTTGERVGVVSDVIQNTAQDLIEVTTERGTRLIPSVPEIVTEIDTEAGRIVIDPPAGLLD
jgi:16S rRNA processing protein RimM